ncbi:MAG: MFS transporter [Acidobacteria bacterium]|nr:MFS transporter [Acidobacteriota bacterium]
MKKSFYGWWVTAAAFLTFGLSVGLPYYNISFFYDYFEKTYGWSKAQITFGFPLAAILTIWIGPIVIPRFSPRKLILVGTGLTCLAFLGFGNMGGSIYIYWGLWFLYTVGYILSGPIPHQIIVSQWFRKNRGKAMGVLYVGVGLIGFLGSFMVKPLTENLTPGQALMVMGGLLLLAWPLAIFVLRDKPAEKGQYPDGAATPPAEILVASHTYKALARRYSFWLLVAGSACSIGSIGAVNFHMKFVFQDQLDANAKNPARARALAAKGGLIDPAANQTVENLKQLGPHIAATGIRQPELARVSKNPEEFRALALSQGVPEAEHNGVLQALKELLDWLQKMLNSTWRAASMIILASSIGGRLLIGAFSDKFNKKWVMTISYFLSALTIPLLLMTVTPPATPWVFALLFGFAMGADYMLIPLMAAEQFGVNSLARCMAIILPVNTIAQTWFPYFVSLLRENFGSYVYAMGVVFVVALMSAVCIALLPRKEKEVEALHLQDAGGPRTQR